MKLFTHQDVRELPCTFRELGSHSDWVEGVLKVRLGRLRPFIVPFSLTFFSPLPCYLLPGSDRCANLSLPISCSTT